MKYWTRSERIINKTLALLNDLSVGYSSVRKLMKLDSIHFILANHTVRNNNLFFLLMFIFKIFLFHLERKFSIFGI